MKNKGAIYVYLSTP